MDRRHAALDLLCDAEQCLGVNNIEGARHILTHAMAILDGSEETDQYGERFDEDRRIVARSGPWRGRCTTNLDEFKAEKWPTIFAAVPDKGDRVVAESGRHLKVVEVRHAEQKGEPFLIIELHR